MVRYGTKTRLIHKWLIKEKDWWISLFLPALGDLTFPSRPLITAFSLPTTKTFSLIHRPPGARGPTGPLLPQDPEPLLGWLTCFPTPSSSSRTFEASRSSFQQSQEVGGWGVERRWGPNSRRRSWWGGFSSIRADSRGQCWGNWEEGGLSFMWFLLLWASLRLTDQTKRERDG